MSRRCSVVEHREIFHDEMLVMRRIMRGRCRHHDGGISISTLRVKKKPWGNRGGSPGHA